MQECRVTTCAAVEAYDGPRETIKDLFDPERQVPVQFYVPESQLSKWRYCKSAKKEPRVTRAGFEYNYSEGNMAFPNKLDKPSGTILTSEDGKGAARPKRIVMVGGRYRRLVPDELDQPQGFPKGWSDTGMTDGQRAFCMGNALCIEIPRRIGRVIAEECPLGK